MPLILKVESTQGKNSVSAQLDELRHAGLERCPAFYRKASPDCSVAQSSKCSLRRDCDFRQRPEKAPQRSHADPEPTVASPQDESRAHRTGTRVS
jgi:hypothetical protein